MQFYGLDLLDLEYFFFLDSNILEYSHIIIHTNLIMRGMGIEPGEVLNTGLHHYLFHWLPWGTQYMGYAIYAITYWVHDCIPVHYTKYYVLRGQSACYYGRLI